MNTELLLKPQKIDAEGSATSTVIDISKYSDVEIGVISTAVNAEVQICAGVTADDKRPYTVDIVKLSSAQDEAHKIAIKPNGEKGQFYSVVFKNVGTVPVLLSAMIIGKLKYSK